MFWQVTCHGSDHEQVAKLVQHWKEPTPAFLRSCVPTRIAHKTCHRPSHRKDTETHRMTQEPHNGPHKIRGHDPMSTARTHEHTSTGAQSASTGAQEHNLRAREHRATGSCFIFVI